MQQWIWASKLMIHRLIVVELLVYTYFIKRIDIQHASCNEQLYWCSISVCSPVTVIAIWITCEDPNIPTWNLARSTPRALQFETLARLYCVGLSAEASLIYHVSRTAADLSVDERVVCFARHCYRCEDASSLAAYQKVTSMFWNVQSWQHGCKDLWEKIWGWRARQQFN